MLRIVTRQRGPWLARRVHAEPRRTLAQLEAAITGAGVPVTLFEASRPYRYYVPALLFGFIASYNLFDMLTWIAPLSVELLDEDLQPETLSVRDKARALATRLGPLALLSSAYAAAALTCFSVPARLVKSLRYDPVTRVCELRTFWGRGAPRLPLAEYRTGRYARAYTGQGPHGASGRGFFLLLWHRGSRVPYILDRQSAFYGSAALFDRLLNSPCALPVDADAQQSAAQAAGASFSDASRNAVFRNAPRKPRPGAQP